MERQSDRFDFPDGVIRVTAGVGGEALLITGSEKTALLDCGMAYCGETLIENIGKALAGRDLDYVLVSHTHYDHLGALPFVRESWPGAVTLGAEYARYVLGRQGAIDTINAFGENARKLYGDNKGKRPPDGGFVIDKTIGDGDVITLGREEITVIETKGHTDCSLTFALSPQNIIFLSESTGVLEGSGKVHVTILKSYGETMRSVEKCRKYSDWLMVLPHYGLLPKDYNEEYWELFLSTVLEYREFLFGLFREGVSEEEILEKYAELRRGELSKKEQPDAAFIMNSRNVIKAFKREFEAENDRGL